MAKDFSRGEVFFFYGSQQLPVVLVLVLVLGL